MMHCSVGWIKYIHTLHTFPQMLTRMREKAIMLKKAFKNEEELRRAVE